MRLYATPLVPSAKPGGDPLARVDFFDNDGKLIVRSQMITPRYELMPLTRLREPFDHPDWIFELKYDGFRALPFLGCHSEFVSRNGFNISRFTDLAL